MPFIQHAAVALIGFTLAASVTTFIAPTCPPLSIAVGCLAGLFCADLLAEAGWGCSRHSGRCGRV